MKLTKISRLCQEITKSLEGKAVHQSIESEVVLARQFSVSRGTVREALDRLVQEGIIYRKRPLGTFVSPTRRNRKVIITVPHYPAKVIPTDFPFFLLELMKAISVSDQSLLPLLYPLEKLAKAPEALSEELEKPSCLVVYGQAIRLADAFGKNIVSNIPTICVGSNYFVLPGASSCVVRETDIAKLSYRVLAKGGLKNLTVFGPENYPLVAKRGQCFRELLMTHGVPNQKAYASEASFLKALKNNSERVGVFCTTDESAIRLTRFCAQQAIPVPERVRILGVEGAPISQLSGLAVSQIALPHQELAAGTTQLILESIAGGVNQLILPPKLIARGTTVA